MLALGPLETDRLLLRPRTVEDAALLFRLWTERDPRVPAHRRISPDGHPTVAEIAARIDAAEDPELMTVVLRCTGEAIGYCGLSHREDRPTGQADLAYELAQASHGHGYATEAAWAVVTWAAASGYSHLWAGVWDWNRASRRVLEKLGFRQTGPVVAESAHGRMLMTVRDFSTELAEATDAAD